MKLFSKRNICYLITLICIVGIQNVQASEEDIYYTNTYNVSFTKKQYDFFTAMYKEGYQELITPEIFAMYEGNDMDPNSVVSKTYIEYLPPLTRATEVTSRAKSLKISRSIGYRCSISVSLDWLGSPTIRSYDVMGAYTKDTTLVGTPYTATYAGGTSTIENDIKKTSTGFGVSILLPSKDYISISQTYNTTTGGRVYASYQHAMVNVTQSDSKNYTIGIAGLGNVFDFVNSVRGKYDAMEGVYVDC